MSQSCWLWKFKFGNLLASAAFLPKNQAYRAVPENPKLFHRKFVSRMPGFSFNNAAKCKTVHEPTMGDLIGE